MPYIKITKTKTKYVYMMKGKSNTKYKWLNINDCIYLVQFSSFNTHR